MITTIKQLLAYRLPNSPTAKLDIELLLAKALDKPTSYLYTWPEKEVDEASCKLFYEYVARREQGEPVAYILGQQGFWSLDLQVSPHTLIPRADTETLVEIVLQHIASGEALNVLDLGTGTGAIALAIASERPNSHVLGVDFIPEAVTLANHNQQVLKITNTTFLVSHWFSALADRTFDIIVSNPPYIADNDVHLMQDDVRFEPKTALVSGKDGMDDIAYIIQHAPSHLASKGWLFFEHGYQQAETVRALLKEQGFISINTYQDLGHNDRVTGGQWIC